VAAHGRALGGGEGRVQGKGRNRPTAPGQVLEQELRRLDVVDPRQLLDELAVFRGKELALALLPRLASMRKIERGLARLAVQQQVGVRRLDAGQVVELVRLAEARVAGRARRALQDGPGLLADRVVHLAAPRRELLGREVAREERDVLGAGRARPREGGREERGGQRATGWTDRDEHEEP